MKNKKNKTMRKAMLMVIASVLVAAVSIGATLAYLTAVTEEKDNIFYASGGIDPKWVEPNFDSEVALVYKPGDDVDKDPIVHNNTDDLGIYVGAKVDFYIAFDGNTYTRVPYELFEEYVTIDWNTTGYDTTNCPGAKWTEVTDDVTEIADTKTAKNTSDLVKSDNSTKYKWSKYYLYDLEIGKKKSNDSAIDDDTYESGFSEAVYTASNTDASAPLFTKVTPDAKIMISTDSDSTTATKLKKSGPVVTDIYKNFDFKIIINGWGVSSANTTKAAAQDEIKTHLGSDIAVYSNSDTLLTSTKLQ